MDAELKTSVRFRTNLDCCKRMMAQVSGLPLDRINPLVGDSVRVYKDSGFELYLRVVDRTWELVNGAQPTLVCELGIPSYVENITHLEKILRAQNFRW